jgi:copper resistance protein D
VPGSVPTLGVLIAAVSDVSYALIVGTCLAASWLDASWRAEGFPSALQRKPASALPRMRLVCFAVLAACYLVRPWLIAASMSGSSGFAALPFVPDVLSSTRQGVLWYVNSVALAALIATDLTGSRLVRPIVTWTVLVSLCVLAATKAASSHAADNGDFTLVEISQLFHLLATAVWAGAISLPDLSLARFCRNFRTRRFSGASDTACPRLSVGFFRCCFFPEFIPPAANWVADSERCGPLRGEEYC